MGSRAGMVLVVASLAACGGHGNADEESNQFCHTIGRGGSTCSTCTQVSNQGQAFDGNLATYALMLARGSGTFEGKATQVQPAGSAAGVYLVVPNGGGVSVSITTLRNGTQQEVSGVSSLGDIYQNCQPGMDCRSQSDGQSFIGLQTTKDYDTLQATVTNSGGPALQVHELCAY